MSDGEWHTVPAKGPHQTQAPASQGRRKSKQRGGAGATGSSNTKRSTHTKPKTDSGAAASKPLERRKSVPSKAPTAERTTMELSNPYHLPENDDTDEEDEEDESPDPIDLPVPPYHTTIIISCPFQKCPASEPFTDTTSLVSHLRKEHHIVFNNLHHMYMALDPYLSQWAKEIQAKSLKEYGSEDKEEKGVYIIDPEHCELDKKIREEMQRSKLNEILQTQQAERGQDSKRTRKCLFCKIVCDNRQALFKHMFSEHNFNIGLPDNLVNVNEFLDMLENKLSHLQCLYCEKTFTSPAVLRKHMRKKKHFKIASKNRQYDRFYVINYLEPGKNWENFEHDTYESDDEKRDESWADWEEEESEPTMCLFDEQVLPSPKEALEHMKQAHGFDLTAIRKEKGYDFYKTIVLINYIRHQSSLATCFSCHQSLQDFSDLVSHMKTKGCLTKFVSDDADFWKDPKYLLPTYDNDPLLTGFGDEESDVDEDLDMPDDEANKKFMSLVRTEALEASEKKAKDNQKSVLDNNNK